MAVISRIKGAGTRIMVSNWSVHIFLFPSSSMDFIFAAQEDGCCNIQALITYCDNLSWNMVYSPQLCRSAPANDSNKLHLSPDHRARARAPPPPAPAQPRFGQTFFAQKKVLLCLVRSKSWIKPEEWRWKCLEGKSLSPKFKDLIK